MTKSDSLPHYFSAARLITEYVTLEDEKRKVTYLNPFSEKDVTSIAHHLSVCVLIGRALSEMIKSSEKTIDPSLLDSLLMWHDAPETRYGDIGRDRRKYVLINEHKARVDEFGSLPFGDEIISLIEKFEAGGENVEVRLAKDADALYVITTIKDFLKRGIRINNPTQRIERTLKRLSTDEGLQLGKELAAVPVEKMWEFLFEKAKYKGPKNDSFQESVSTTMCIGWMLCELANADEEHVDRKSVLHEIFLQRIGSNPHAHDARIIYDQLQQKRDSWKENVVTSSLSSPMLLTAVGKKLAEVLTEIDLFDWWNLAQGYADVTETGALRHFSR